jgi:hypothetical protein
MKLIGDFFRDSSGQGSATRLNTNLAAWSGIVMACLTIKEAVVNGRPIDMNVVWLIVTLLAYSSGTKVFQKMIESKVGNKSVPVVGEVNADKP